LERDAGDGFWVAWISVGIGGLVSVEEGVVLGEEAIVVVGLFKEAICADGVFEEKLQRKISKML